MVEIDVHGLTPPTGDRYKKMKNLYDLCIDLGIPMPETVDEFFYHKPPDQDGVVRPIPFEEKMDGDLTEIRIETAKIPMTVKVVRIRVGQC